MENNKKIVKTKQSATWNLTFYLLEQIYLLPEAIGDKTFFEKLEELTNYVSEKITPTYDADVTDIYVVIEQEATDEEYEAWLKSNKQ